MKPVCGDLNVVRNLRCVRDQHDAQTLHRNGLFVWGSVDPAQWQPEWRKQARFRRDLGTAA